ncbi:hypothetical protein GCM10008961_03090 [Deinococcus knuensis]|uniref:Uncharacterized protein n=1 Tax=Deinococcus knuensis TaxID=1837380 RepID=A0ABQ2SAL7_9DEIO|nr:hypothetical protein GCM10008961_03090 [Deinococcus knuensis]
MGEARRVRPGSGGEAGAPAGNRSELSITQTVTLACRPVNPPAPTAERRMRNPPMFGCCPDLLDCLVSEAEAVPYAFNVTPGGPVYV